MGLLKPIDKIQMSYLLETKYIKLTMEEEESSCSTAAGVAFFSLKERRLNIVFLSTLCDAYFCFISCFQREVLPFSYFSVRLPFPVAAIL